MQIELSEQDKQDIQNCEKIIVEALKKYGCALKSVATLEPGKIDMTTMVAKVVANPNTPAAAAPSPTLAT